jgi:hypothetical protein
MKEGREHEFRIKAIQLYNEKVKSGVCATLEEATLKAKDFLNKDKDLGLAVVYEQNPDGTREGVKFIYKEEDGTFEDFPLYWGTCDTVCEG